MKHKPQRLKPTRSGCQKKKRSIPKEIRRRRSCGNLKRADVCVTKSRVALLFGGRSCRGRFALSQTDATQAYGESPEIASCEYTGGIRKARIDSSQAARDRQFHETRRCSGSNSLRCTTHINHAYEVGDQTKRNPIGRLGVGQIRSWGAKPTASPTVSRRGRQLCLAVGSQKMRVFTVGAQGSVGGQELHCEPVADLHRQWCTGWIDAQRAWSGRVEKT